MESRGSVNGTQTQALLNRLAKVKLPEDPMMSEDLTVWSLFRLQP
jgi:hypothetical protein